MFSYSFDYDTFTILTCKSLFAIDNMSYKGICLVVKDTLTNVIYSFKFVGCTL